MKGLQMMNRRQPDFMMGLNLPINIPTEEEIEMLTNPETIEPFLQALIEAGHMSAEEVAAYIKFVSEFATFTPFVMDSFLQSYRNAMAQKKEEEGGRIIKPNGPGKLIVPG